MKKKLNRFLLVDDDEATNYIHTIIIKNANCVENVASVQNGYEALDYLSTKIDGSYPQPEFIFLDINMPGMNGWEFLEEYEKLPVEKKGNMIIVLLTTSLNPDDAEHAKSIKAIDDFRNKPLSVEVVKNLVEEHHPHLF